MIINLSHFKGGVGKTTLTINIAIALKKIGYDVSILDLDGLQSSILFNKMRVKNGYSSINCLAIETLEEMKMVFKEFNNDAKFLIVDSGGYDGDINRFAMLNADIIITPVAPSQVELFGLQKYTSILKHMSEKTGQIFKTNIIINNADVRSQGAIKELQNFIKDNDIYMDLYKTVVCSRADFKRAYGEGLGVIELDADCKAASEVISLVKEIQKDF